MERDASIANHTTGGDATRPDGPSGPRQKDHPETLAGEAAPKKRLNTFERYLSLWVAACMIVGLLIGKMLPDLIDRLRQFEFGEGSQINVPIAVLIWLMIIPMMMKVDFASIRNVGKRPRGLLVTLFVNWLVKPFSMALIAWLFFRHVFAAWIGPDEAGSVHRRQHHSGSRSMHRHGLRMELSHRRRPRLYAGAGFPERPDHAGAVRSDRPFPGGRRVFAGSTVSVLLYSVGCFIVIPLVAGVALRVWFIHRKGISGSNRCCCRASRPSA